jgi:hypothetical protein
MVFNRLSPRILPEIIAILRTYYESQESEFFVVVKTLNFYRTGAVSSWLR